MQRILFFWFFTTLAISKVWAADAGFSASLGILECEQKKAAMSLLINKKSAQLCALGYGAQLGLGRVGGATTEAVEASCEVIKSYQHFVESAVGNPEESCAKAKARFAKSAATLSGEMILPAAELAGFRQMAAEAEERANDFCPMHIPSSWLWEYWRANLENGYQ